MSGAFLVVDTTQMYSQHSYILSHARRHESAAANTMQDRNAMGGLTLLDIKLGFTRKCT